MLRLKLQPRCALSRSAPDPGPFGTVWYGSRQGFPTIMGVSQGVARRARCIIPGRRAADRVI